MSGTPSKYTIVNSWYGGISDDPRKNTPLEFIISKHFDIFSYPNKLTPYRDFAADTNDGSTSTGMKQYLLKDFVYSSTAPIEYALGVNGSGNTKIVYKADATTGNWTVPGSSEGNAAVQNGCFVEYKDYLWGFQGTNQVFKWGTLSGSPSITNSVGTVGATISSVAQGLIGKDDNLYLPYNNKLARVDSTGTLNDAVLTLPTNYKITSLTRYGNYLAIACSPAAGYNGISTVFLWNYTSTDIQESIDWGDGELRILENIEGYLVGITDLYLNNANGAGRGSMVIRLYQGGTPQIVKEVFTLKLTGKSIPLSKFVRSNRLFFAAKIMTNTTGTEYNEGIWSFGRKNAGSPFALSLDIIDENINTSGIQAIGAAANFFFIAHSGDGSVDKLNSTASYTFTSILETQIQHFGNPHIDKQLELFSIATTPLLANQSVVIKHKVNDDANWTTIGTFSTVGQTSCDFTQNVDESAFKVGREHKYRIESTGGAEITGYLLKTLALLGSTDETA